MKLLFFFLLVSSFGCKPKHPVSVLPAKPTSACEKDYSEFYKNDVLDFRIVFGYKDARPARYVGDRYERAYLIQKLLNFGFERVVNSEEDFSYSFLGPNRRPKKIKLKLVASSAGPDDDENRKDPYQKWMTMHAQEVFLTGLRSSDLVFYYGHSRDGGGPDFAPPRLGARQHVDYGWYLKHSPGLKNMISGLKANHGRVLPVLGLYSCVSDKLFAKQVLAVSPKTQLMLSKVLLYYIDALNGMMESLTDVIEMKCQADFHPPGTELISGRDLKSLPRDSHP